MEKEVIAGDLFFSSAIRGEGEADERENVTEWARKRASTLLI